MLLCKSWQLRQLQAATRAASGNFRRSTAVAVIVTLQLLVPARGGTCWESVLPGGKCDSLLSYNISQEQCCRLRLDRQLFWTDKDAGLGSFYYHQWVKPGMPGCRPCHVSCDTMKCGSNRRCRIVTGLPRCVCQPDCSMTEAARLYGSSLAAQLIEGDKVCGDDEITYSSYCAMLYGNCQTSSDIRVAYLGECQVRSCSNVTCLRNGHRCIVDQNNMPHCVLCPRRCTAEREPLCGSDGRTYLSPCHMAQHNCLHGLAVMMQHSGECAADVVCDEKTNCHPRLPQSRCVSLSNDPDDMSVCISCAAQCSAQHGSNDSENDKDELPEVTELPVCASNNVTYDSWCLMMSAACQERVHLRALHGGRCDAEEDEIQATISAFQQRLRERLGHVYDSGSSRAEHLKPKRRTSAVFRRRKLV